ncbi:hypothetical protein [Planomonospora sp. ID67723]|uniref:hypothetical protein n=1 Tax=Planomonospora sp. ID67723 TaxID=2738134 RepID=UPI0018C37844|nr:hypothetical protein [Planomonospora sp. ID67723]
MTGLLVGAVFGAVFVVINAQSPLNTLTADFLRVTACLAAASVLAMWFLAVRRERSAGKPAAIPTETAQPATTAQPGTPGMYGRGYLIILVAEVILLYGGLQVLAAWERPEQANVAWIALVVGVHFIALAPVWKDWMIAVPGTVLSLLGVAGLVMVSTGALDWVPFVSGVLSGVVLLAGCVTFGWRVMTATRAQAAQTA